MSAPLVRKSVHIVARNWPKGDAQAWARQILMKWLGILEEEGLTLDDLFLHYSAFSRGPLNSMVVKALMALCGLDDVNAKSAPQA